jgi:pimeloyl-ACP methyl ester carboxylesterase
MKLHTVILATLLSAVSVTASAVISPDLNHKTRILGKGSSTVILEAGLGDTLEVWKDIQPRIAEGCTRTLAYTRAGYLGSDPPSGPRDAATVVAELRAELRKRNVAPPYVLVGHSLGGLYMQYFARNFPNEVIGLVLVDSTHWNQQMAIHTGANRAYTRRSEVTLFMPWIMRREFMDSGLAGMQVHDSPIVQFLPTIVLSSTVGPAGETPAARADAARLQSEIVADFPGAQHVRVEGAGHYIQRDRPDVVVSAVRQLAGCPAEAEGAMRKVSE